MTIAICPPFSIQAQIYQGYGRAAAALGVPHTQCRPTDPQLGLQPWNALTQSLMAIFDTDPKFSFRAPSTYAKPLWFGLFDATTVMVGDYLISSVLNPVNPWDPDGEAIKAPTYFVASLEALHPPLCVACNAVVSIFRPSAGEPRREFYAGNETSEGLRMLAGFPVSILQGTKGEKGTDSLPGDARAPWVSILMPRPTSIVLAEYDLLIDDKNRRYTLSGVELTDLGYRLTAAYSGT